MRSREELTALAERMRADAPPVDPAALAGAEREVAGLRCLWYPAGEKCAPLYLNFHGGGFILGRPEDDDLFCCQVRDTLGVHVLNVDYPLAPEHPYPADKEAGYRVAAFVSKHPEEFYTAPDLLAVGGHSAGGNISAALCLMAAQRQDGVRFRCQLLDYPALDLKTPPGEKPLPQGSIPPDVAELFNACYVSPGEAGEFLCSPRFAPRELLPLLPPAVVVSCARDSLCREAEEYALELARAGVEVTLRRFPGTHGYSLQYGEPGSGEARNMMLETLRRHLAQPQKKH